MKGLYIHIPFCVKKCRYCDFVSYTNRESEYDKYIDALLFEANEYRGENIDTVFIGGGTPSVLNPEQLNRLLLGLGKSFKISPDAEFTIEANPGTLDREKLKAMLLGGVNRLSIGVQSFNDNELRAIGRIHTARQAYETVEEAYKSGFENINIDLMTALPLQNTNSLQNSINTALKLPISHISVYSLIVEEGTPIAEDFALGRFSVSADEEDREMYHTTVEKLKSNGFLQYEISNFAKEGKQCRHNIKYWQCMEYIGLGAAAHSYIGDRRFYNSTSIDEYINGNRREHEALNQSDKIAEFMIMGLRMNEGVSQKEFKKRFNLEMNEIFKTQINKFNQIGVTRLEGDRFYLTERGRDVANAVMCEFV